MKKSSFTPEVRRAILRSLKSGAFIKDACDAAGICRKTYYNWMANAQEGIEPFESFFDEIDKIRADVISSVLSSIVSQTKSDWRAGAWYLEKVRPFDFGRWVGQMMPPDKLSDDQIYEQVTSMYQAVLEARRRDGKPIMAERKIKKLPKGK